MGGQRRLWRARPSGRLAAASLLVAALATALISSEAVDAGRPQQSSRPNVVVITTDDQTVESLRVMANVNRMLVAQGTTFANSFATFPLCCPSRATFLTGQYSHNHGVVGNSYFNGLARLDQSNTLPVWLSKAGYSTIFVGKYLNGYGRTQPKAIPPGWTEWYGGLRMAYLDHTMNRNGRIVRYRGRDAYQSDVYGRTAVEAILRHGPGARPFFLWLSFFAPHVGGPPDLDDPVGLATPSPAPRHRDLFALEALPTPESFGETDASDKPAGIQSRRLLGNDDVAALQESYRQRLESLLAVDEAIASVVDALRATRALGRTLIVFTSDNGFFHGEHRVRSGKELIYEPSIRVPLVVRGPGVPKRLRLEQPVGNIDLAPTIAAATGIRPGRVFDGRPLQPLLADPGLEWGRDLLIERGPGSSGLGQRMVTAIRTPRYLYAVHATGERELYDLDRDPLELASLHGSSELAEVESELARRLATLQDCVGAACSPAPALELSVTAQGCTRTAVVGGDDAGRVDYVDLGAGAAVVVRDADPPFDRELPADLAGPMLRGRVVLTDGRRLTLDRPLPSCR
jgi:N-acetylglucosamine-6-sulfatase